MDINGFVRNAYESVCSASTVQISLLMSPHSPRNSTWRITLEKQRSALNCGKYKQLGKENRIGFCKIIIYCTFCRTISLLSVHKSVFKQIILVAIISSDSTSCHEIYFRKKFNYVKIKTKFKSVFTSLGLHTFAVAGKSLNRISPLLVEVGSRNVSGYGDRNKESTKVVSDMVSLCNHMITVCILSSFQCYSALTFLKMYSGWWCGRVFWSY